MISGLGQNYHSRLWEATYELNFSHGEKVKYICSCYLLAMHFLKHWLVPASSRTHLLLTSLQIQRIDCKLIKMLAVLKGIFFST